MEGEHSNGEDVERGEGERAKEGTSAGSNEGGGEEVDAVGFELHALQLHKPRKIHDLVSFVRQLLMNAQDDLGFASTTTKHADQDAGSQAGSYKQHEADLEEGLLNTLSAMHIVEWELPHISRRAKSFSVDGFCPFNGYNAVMLILSSILQAIQVS